MLKGLKALRIRAKKTQAGIAANVGISQNYYNELERGVKVNPSSEIILRLADELGCDIGELFKERGQTA